MRKVKVKIKNGFISPKYIRGGLLNKIILINIMDSME